MGAQEDAGADETGAERQPVVAEQRERADQRVEALASVVAADRDDQRRVGVAESAQRLGQRRRLGERRRLVPVLERRRRRVRQPPQRQVVPVIGGELPGDAVVVDDDRAHLVQRPAFDRGHHPPGPSELAAVKSAPQRGCPERPCSRVSLLVSCSSALKTVVSGIALAPRRRSRAAATAAEVDHAPRLCRRIGPGSAGREAFDGLDDGGHEPGALQRACDRPRRPHR